MQLAFVRVPGSKCGSRKNSAKPSECIFFISLQTRIAPRKIGFGYDEWMSGQTIYAYVGGNPVSLSDPTGQSPYLLGGGIVLACYGVYKFFDSSNTALQKGATYQDMQSQMHDWMKSGMQGTPPYTQGQLQDAQQGIVNSASQAAGDGAKVIPQPLIRTGSLLNFLTK